MPHWVVFRLDADRAGLCLLSQVARSRRKQSRIEFPSWLRKERVSWLCARLTCVRSWQTAKISD